MKPSSGYRALGLQSWEVDARGPLRYHIEGPLSQVEDEINIEFVHQGGAWNLKSLHGIPLAQYHIQPNKLIWQNSNGQSNVKEASNTHEEIQIDKSQWNWIWKTPCLQKKKKKKNLTFIWKCIHNRIHILCCSPPTWYWPWVSLMSKFWKYFTFILDCHRAKEFWIALLGQWEIFIFP